MLYPAVPGSEEGLDPMVVDIRYALPESERDKVTDDVRPHQSCDCYEDLPIDGDSQLRELMCSPHILKAPSLLPTHPPSSTLASI